MYTSLLQSGWKYRIAIHDMMSSMITWGPVSVLLLCTSDRLSSFSVQAGSNFRAMYVVDWDKDNYFSVLNVRKRKFEKERVERQLQAEAERIRKEEIEARQAELARAEVERLKMEQMAAALRCVSDLLDMNMVLRNLHCSTLSWHESNVNFNGSSRKFGCRGYHSVRF